MQVQTKFTGHNAAIFALAPGNDASHFFSAGGDGWIVSWDINEPDLGKVVATAPEQVFSICYLAKQQQIVAGTMNGGIHWLSLHPDTAHKHIAHHKKGTYALLNTPFGLISGGGDGKITRWDVAAQRSVETLQLSHESVRCLAWEPTRQLLAVGCSDNFISIIDGATFTRVHRFQAHENSVFSLCFLPNGNLVSGGRDAHLRLWSSGFDELKALPAHWFTINDLVLSPDGKNLASASRDKTVKIWDVQDLSLIKVFESVRDKGHVNSVNALVWTQQLLSAGDDRQIIAWRQATND